MSTTLYLAPTTDAILRHIDEHVRQVQRERLLAPLTFLLPSGDAIRQLRRVLGNVIGVRFHQFYNLSSAVLAQTGSAVHELSDLARRRVVRSILDELDTRGQLTTFSPMLNKPGFIDVLVEWLREMKTQGITPEAVVDHAETSHNARDMQLSTFYMRYQAVLRQLDCADADGLLWLAAEALERDATLLRDAGELILAGFDQFSPVQLRTVKALANRLPVTIYLLWDADRPDRSLALGRLAPTRDALRSALAPIERPLAAVDGCGPALSAIRRSLFETGRPAVADPTRSVRAVAAPSTEAEVRYALRQIKRLLLAGVPAEQIALLAPQPGSYQAIVGAVSREYGVPLACETILGENPCVAALLNLLTLAPNFPWRQTFDALHSPYVRQPWLDAQQIALLDVLTRERPVVRGEDQWWYALTRSGPDGMDAADAAEDEDRSESPRIEQLEPDVVAALRAGVAAFFRHLTPANDVSPAGYVAWIQDALLGVSYEDEPDSDGAPATAISLRMVEAAETGAWAERDRRALHALLRALRTWLDAVAVSDGVAKTGSASGQQGRGAAAFASELLEWLPSVPVRPDSKHAAVRFGALEANRAVTVEHLFVLGLGEGELPRQPTPDPFYTVTERAAHPLPLIRKGTAEDASLWWQVLCNCECTLTLLRSRYDANGAAWLPSAYWSAVVDLIDGLEVDAPRLGTRLTIEDAASHSELLEALALGGITNRVAALAGPWSAVMAAREVAQMRDGWRSLSEYEGVVRDGQVMAHLRQRYGPGRTWSLSRLNKYGACPFAFWAQHVLELATVTDPVEGMDALQRGSLVHKVLEKLFLRLAAAGIAPGPATVESVAVLLDAVCDEVLPRAAEQYGFRHGPLWEHEQAELRAELQVYMAWECAPEQAGRYRPFRQELKFGLGPKSLRRVRLPGLEGAEITLRGVIDRIDADAAGHLRVIDYKTGSRRLTENDILSGRALQSALYAWAVEALMPDAGVVVETCYRHTGKRCESGRLVGDSAQQHPVVLQAAAKAVQMAGAVAEGWFAALPSKGSTARACDEPCDFLGLCRVTRQGVRKAQREGLPFTGAGDDPGYRGAACI